MSTVSLRMVTRSLLLSALLATTPAVVVAQSAPPAILPPGTNQPAATPRNESHWLQKLTRLVSPPNKAESYRREHPTVMEAFREVVGRPSKSTVRVYRDAECVALGTIVARDG